MATFRAGEPSPLLELPRELRDIIYTFCTSDNDIEPPKQVSSPNYEGPTRVLLRNTPAIGLLCANHQLHDEYLPEAKKQTTLLFVDHFEKEMPNIPNLHLKLQNVTHIDILLLAMCRCGVEQACPFPGECDVVRDLKHHVQWIHMFTAGLNELKSIDITIHACWPKEAEDLEWPKSPFTFDFKAELEGFVAIGPRVSRMEVHRYRIERYPERLDTQDVDKVNSDLYVTWSKGDGWKGPEKVPEKAVEEVSELIAEEDPEESAQQVLQQSVEEEMDDGLADAVPREFPRVVWGHTTEEMPEFELPELDWSEWLGYGI